MREIKFRAWDKIKEKFVNTNRISYCVSGDIIVRVEYIPVSGGVWEPKSCVQLTWPEAENIILMQYTGLKDKNGKEIYEGDIIICDFDRLNGEIEWDSFMYWKTELCLTADTIEIIGNKYENPELLEV